MQLSKLSKNTYHKCLKELHTAQYIFYHPSPAKFLAVRISIIHLVTEEEQPSRYQQLELFAGLELQTARVANLRPLSTNFATGTVANPGHIIKPNNKQKQTHPLINLDRKEEKKEKPGVENLSSSYVLPPALASHELPPAFDLPPALASHELPPALAGVLEYFNQKNHPAQEAQKFFNHYKALGWKIQGKTPIHDWQALAEKWMANTKKWNSNQTQTNSPNAIQHTQNNSASKDIQFLFESFLEGKKISHLITVDHFNQLNLKLNENILQQAWQERINQLAGSNQYSQGQLWQAYLSNSPGNPLIENDKTNLIALAKRLAVFHHFHALKQSGTSLPP